MKNIHFSLALLILIFVLPLITTLIYEDSIEMSLDSRDKIISKPMIFINDTILNQTEINNTEIINQTEINETVIINNTIEEPEEINSTEISEINETELINETFEEIFEFNETEMELVLELGIPIVSGAPKMTTYVYAGNMKLATKTNDEEFVYHYADRLGSERLNSLGAVSKTLPFGQEIESSERFAFTGKELDDSGLNYFNVRYYDSDLGRFTSIDPFTGSGGNLAYAYVSNNPLSKVDSTGMGQGDYQNVIFSTNGMPKRTPLVLDFSTNQEVLAYKAKMDSLLIKIKADTTGTQYYIPSNDGADVLSVPGFGKSIRFPLFENNLIESSLVTEFRMNGPVENVIFLAHRNEADKGQIIFDSILNTMNPVSFADLDSTLSAMSDTLFSQNGDAQIIFGVCGADSLMDGQVIADSLGVSVYMSNNPVQYIQGMNPPLIYGDFNEYIPTSQSPNVPKSP